MMLEPEPHPRLRAHRLATVPRQRAKERVASFVQEQARKDVTSSDPVVSRSAVLAPTPVNINHGYPQADSRDKTRSKRKGQAKESPLRHKGGSAQLDDGNEDWASPMEIAERLQGRKERRREKAERRGGAVDVRDRTKSKAARLREEAKHKRRNQDGSSRGTPSIQGSSEEEDDDDDDAAKMERRRRKRNKTAGATDRIMLGSAYDLLNTIPKCDEHRTGRLTYPVSSGRIGAGLMSKARISEQYRTSKKGKGVPDLTFSSMKFFRGLAKREKQTRRREKQMVTSFSATSSTTSRRDIKEKDIKRTTDVLEEAITRALRRLGEDNAQLEAKRNGLEVGTSTPRAKKNQGWKRCTPSTQVLSSDGVNSTAREDEVSRKDSTSTEVSASTPSIRDEEQSSRRSAYSQARRSGDQHRKKLGPGKETKKVIRAPTTKSVVVDVGSMPWSASRIKRKHSSRLDQLPSTCHAPSTDAPLSNESTVTADPVERTEAQAGPWPPAEGGAKATPMLAYGPHGAQQPANAWKARHARSDSLEAWELREIANENAKKIRLDYGPPVPGLVASPFYAVNVHSPRGEAENITVHNDELGQIGGLEVEGDEEEVSQYGVKEEETSRCSTCGCPDENIDVEEAEHLVRYEEVDGSERPLEEVRQCAYLREQSQRQDFVHPQYEDERDCDDEMQHDEELVRLHSPPPASMWSSHGHPWQEQAVEGIEGLFRPAWLRPGHSSLAARLSSSNIDQARSASSSKHFDGQNGKGSDSLLVPQDQLKGFWKPFWA